MITICFTGHRPDKLGGYNWHTKKNQLILKELYNSIEKEIIENNAKTFIFGGALGIDQMAFEVVKKLQERCCHDIKMILAVPFKNQAIKWFNQTDVSRYEAQLKWADEVVYVDTLEDYKLKNFDEGTYHPAKMDLRNRYMVDYSDKVFAVWNGTKGGTGNCVNYAKKQGKEIIGFNPDRI